eukprot:2691-Eustigmatos_ZCMA.PRE.1
MVASLPEMRLALSEKATSTCPRSTALHATDSSLALLARAPSGTAPGVVIAQARQGPGTALSTDAGQNASGPCGRR